MYEIELKRYEIHPKVWSSFPIPIFPDDDGFLTPYTEKMCVEGRGVWVGKSLNEITYDMENIFFSEDKNVVLLCLQVLRKYPSLRREEMRQFLKLKG